MPHQPALEKAGTCKRQECGARSLHDQHDLISIGRQRLSYRTLSDTQLFRGNPETELARCALDYVQ